MIRKGNFEAKEGLDCRYKLLVYKMANVYLMKYHLSNTTLHDARQAGFMGYEKSIRNYDASRLTGLAHFVKLTVIDHIRTSIRTHISLKGMMNHYAVSLDSTISDDGKLDYHDVIASENRSFCPETYTYIKEVDHEMSYMFKSTITDTERRIFVMKAQGYAYKEIAQTLDLTSKQVDNILQKLTRKVELFKDYMN